jgi:hypothetical protein
VKRVLAGILLAALVAAAQADDAPKTETPAQARPALEVPPNRLGYDFDHPEVLIRQRLFGLAHGLSMLAAACLDLPEHSTPIQNAYAAWHAEQAKAIETLVLDLARHYFGPRAVEARWQDLARALNLNDSIHPALGQVSLQDACASLPEAIARPRYQFDKLLAEADASAIKPPAPAAEPTAATPEKPLHATAEDPVAGTIQPASIAVESADPKPKPAE